MSGKVKIEADKPLPTHTKLDYYECYAKIALESFGFFEVDSLQVADKPDLQNIRDSIGIEVTIAEQRKNLEAENLQCKSLYWPEQVHIKEHKKSNNQFNKGKDDFELINQAIQGKVDKLQKGGYSHFNNFALFIYSSIYANDSMLQAELDYLRSELDCLINKGASSYYGMVYIFAPNEIYYFDLLSKKYCRIETDNNKRYECALKARKMVEVGEEI